MRKAREGKEDREISNATTVISLHSIRIKVSNLIRIIFFRLDTIGQAGTL